MATARKRKKAGKKRSAEGYRILIVNKYTSAKVGYIGRNNERWFCAQKKQAQIYKTQCDADRAVLNLLPVFVHKKWTAITIPGK